MPAVQRTGRAAVEHVRRRLLPRGPGDALRGLRLPGTTGNVSQQHLSVLRKLAMDRGALDKPAEGKSHHVIVVGLLSWLIPGAGHIYLGQRSRGIVIFLAISCAFWIGVFIGGAHSTVNWVDNRAWFFAQIFAGAYALLTMLIGYLPSAMASYGKTLDLATIYTGVAGLLNVLVILDALGRSATASELKEPSRK